MFHTPLDQAKGAVRNAAKPRAQMLLQVRCVDEKDCVSMIRVRNLSETGLGGKVISGMSPRLDDDVALILRGEERIFGRIAWIEDKLIGVSFDRPFDMESLTKSWTGPSFEVSEQHAKIGEGHSRSGNVRP